MKKLIYIVVILSILTSCREKSFEPNYEITAHFNEENITIEQKNKIVEILRKRFSAYKLRNEITFNKKEITVKLENKMRKIDQIGLEKLITTQGNIRFWHTYKNSEIGDKIFKISNKIISKTPSLSNLLLPSLDKKGEWIESSILGKSKIQDTAQINYYLKRKQLTDSLPQDISFMWETAPSSASDYGDLFINLYLIKKTESGISKLDNSHIEKAKNTSDLLKKNALVTLYFTEEGKNNWAKMTEHSATNKSGIAMTIDNKVFTAQSTSSKIVSDKIQITGGSFNGENGGNTAYNLVIIINNGILPFSLNLIETKKLD